MALMLPQFRTLNFGNYEIIHVSVGNVLSHPVRGTLLRSPWNLIQFSFIKSCVYFIKLLCPVYTQGTVCIKMNNTGESCPQGFPINSLVPSAKSQLKY